MEQILLEEFVDGNIITYEVMLTYHDDETNKDYVVYTDKSYNELGKLNLFYSLYKLEDGKIKLLETIDIQDQKVGLELIKEMGKMLIN